ncbi:hypothetical protein WJX72_000588 [[Myrmecia] bisecta]|uniref:Chloride channel protein n=1 Tax=[Myrmecia] bisecta TaxID=41462 RepID=A0AAW1Q3B0_9CHLO
MHRSSYVTSTHPCPYIANQAKGRQLKIETDTPLEATNWGRWARQLPLLTSWSVLVLPPTVGGVLLQPASEAQRQVLAVIRPILKATAAAISLGTGASLGPEGPSVEIGRSAATALGAVLRSKQRRIVALVAAGSGAGVAAGFNAPISGVFFAVETVLQRQKRDAANPVDESPGLTVAMVLLASVLAAIVSQAGLGASPAFRVPEYELQSLYELPLTLLLGALCGLVSTTFTYTSTVSNEAFKSLKTGALEEAALPALGGLITGVVALGYPEVLYQGFGNVNAILQSHGADYAPALLIQIVVLKIFTTAVCRGSGLVGGIYAPSIFMGATLGSAFGGIAQLIGTPLGLDVTQPQAYALVGVAGMLAANCRVPLTAVLLLFELTHDYFIIVPTLGAVGISFWVASLPMQTLTFFPGKFFPWTRNLPGSNAAAIASKFDKAKRIGRAGMSSGSNQRSEQDQLSGPAADVDMTSPQEAAKVATLETVERMSGGSVEELSVRCALEQNCVLLSLDTSMAEALSVIDEVGQSAALVTDASGTVVGFLTRESILRQLDRLATQSAKQNGTAQRPTP